MRQGFYIILLVSYALLGVAPPCVASIHSAPIVLRGEQIKAISHYPISMYRAFKTNAKGEAEPIPFQIDEINQWGDYVLPEGEAITATSGNGIFDAFDEIAFMGDDVGPDVEPTTWPLGKPHLVYKLTLSLGQKSGAVYLGIYFRNAPPLSNKSYVTFNRKTAEVITSRYRYGFDQKNWLVSRLVEMLKKNPAKKNGYEFIPLLESTTFYMKADLKYFLTIDANHRSIDSKLEAYKHGPIRSLIRISFHYKFLKLNFDLDMYTEISFFSNAVYLPAILYNPIDGEKSLNSGSGFYYGLALKENPKDFQITSNIPTYKKSGIFDFLKANPNSEELYWVAASGLDRMIYMEIKPSKKMREAGAIPMFYKEDTSGSNIKARNADSPAPLGESPVNLALYFDMTKFKEGEHMMSFRLFFENRDDPKTLETFKNLSNWNVDIQRLRK